MERTFLTMVVLSVLLLAGGARYTRNNDGIVSDKGTSLQWQDNYSDSGGNIKYAKWIDAIDYCKGLTLGGYTDWRLPNIKELLSIVDRSRHNPAIDDNFQNVTLGDYWSSTSWQHSPSDAWFVVFGDGYSRYYHKSDSHFVRCVRADE